MGNNQECRSKKIKAVRIFLRDYRVLGYSPDVTDTCKIRALQYSIPQALEWMEDGL
jgi:hypothetical protein